MLPHSADDDTRSGRIDLSGCSDREPGLCARPHRLPRARARSLAGLVSGALLVTTMACGGNPGPLDEALAVTDVQTGYHDGGVQAGQNRLLPTLSFRVRNQSSARVSSVQFNAVFRVIGDEEELGAQLIRGIDSSGLQPGDSAGPYVLRSDFGYTGEQARIEMFQHDAFQDVQVELFAKQGGGQWVRLLDQVVDRQLVNIKQ
jgi:hypothetical protein